MFKKDFKIVPLKESDKVMPLAVAANLVIQELASEMLVYNLRTNQAFCLNQSSSLVWQLCDGTKTVPEITRLASENLKSPVTEDFVWLAIDQLSKENLLENNPEIKIKFDGLSRREVIRRIGLGTIIALPVISSLVAPTAAMAQSGGTATCVPIGSGPCTSGGDCCDDQGVAFCNDFFDPNGICETGVGIPP